MKTVSLLLVFICSLTYSQTAVQNDWSGSDKILGPVSDWENNYFYSNNVEYSDGAMRFLLQKLPAVEMNCIDSTMNACQRRFQTLQFRRFKCDTFPVPFLLS